MGKVKELLYKEQNPQFDAEDAFDDYEPPWAGDEQLKDAMGNTEYESKLAELLEENKKLKEENEIYKKEFRELNRLVDCYRDKQDLKTMLYSDCTPLGFSLS